MLSKQNWGAEHNILYENVRSLFLFFKHHRENSLLLTNVENIRQSLSVATGTGPLNYFKKRKLWGGGFPDAFPQSL